MGDIYHKGDTYAGSVPIDDTQTTATNTWSAQKINNEIDTKASKSIITSNDVFDPTKAYAAGDWLIHNNILYEVLVACTGVTPPNATYYKVKNLHDLQNEIDTLNSGVNALKNTTTSTITKGTSGSATIGGTLSTNTIIKSGRVVIVSALLDGIGGISDMVNCYPFIVPNGYRPFTATHVPVLFQLTGNSNLYICLCPVLPDGRIQFAYQVSEASKSALDRLVLLNGTWIS